MPAVIQPSALFMLYYAVMINNVLKSHLELLIVCVDY